MSTKKKGKAIRGKNQLEPLCDDKCKVLILGTFPGPKSRAVGEYYSNPTNRFWKVIDGVCNKSSGKLGLMTYKDKKAFLKSHGIALWDTCESCEIEGAADSSIRKVEPNDIKSFLSEHKQVKKIVCNGSKAKKLFRRYFKDLENNKDIEVEYLPSTSGANTRCKTDYLIEKYKAILQQRYSSIDYEVNDK